MGVYEQYLNNVVRGNSVSNMTSGGSSAASLVMGISAGVAPTGGVTIERNNVQNIGNTNPATWPAVGINLNGGNNNIVRNNFVSRIYNDQTVGTGGFNPTFGASGIRLNLGTGHQVYSNSVHMYGAMAGAVSSDLVSALAISATTVTDCDIRNNILSNEMTGGNPAGGNTRFVAINLPPSPTVSMNLTLNNNAYFEGTDPNCRMAVVGQTVAAGDFAAANFNAGSTSPATNFRSVSSTLSAAGTNDNASFASSGAVPFISSSDLHITSSAGPILGGGAAIGSVTGDYDSDPRPATMPDIGADELVQAVAGDDPCGHPLQCACCRRRFVGRRCFDHECYLPER